MHELGQLLHLLLHFDSELLRLIGAWGAWVWALLFAIIFLETGLVVTPILPGDSMLFVVGALCASGSLDLGVGLPLLWLAAVLGDSLNYAIGRAIGRRVFGWKHSRWFNRQAFDRAHAFYQRYGGITVISARFIPFVRTFAPFVAGVAQMAYGRFAACNVLGGGLWVGLLMGAGYAFGNLPWLRGRLPLLSAAVVAVSLLPLAVGWLRARRGARARGA